MSNRSGGTLRCTSNPCSNKLHRLSILSALGNRPDIPTMAIFCDLLFRSNVDFVDPKCSPALTSSSVSALKLDTKLDRALEGPIEEILHLSPPEALAFEITVAITLSNDRGRTRISPTSCLSNWSRRTSGGDVSAFHPRTRND